MRVGAQQRAATPLPWQALQQGQQQLMDEFQPLQANALLQLHQQHAWLTLVQRQREYLAVTQRGSPHTSGQPAR
ncbi:hypothetical protein D3C78_1191100 [compost metagenome]